MKKLQSLFIMSCLGLSMGAMQSPKEEEPVEILDMTLEELYEYTKALPEAPEPHRIIEEWHEIRSKGKELSKGEKERVDRLMKDESTYTTVDDNGTNVFRLAARLGREEIFSRLLESNQKPDILKAKNRHQETLLHIGAKFGNDKIVEMLLSEALIELEAKDSEGKTALHRAAAEGRKNVVVQLRAAGAEVDTTDNEGNTPLTSAKNRGAPEIVGLLKE